MPGRLLPQQRDALTDVAQAIVQSFQQAVQACAEECGRHQRPHCQECAQVLPQVANSTQQLLQSPSQQGMQ